MIDSQRHLNVVAQQRVMSNPYGHSLSPRHAMPEHLFHVLGELFPAAYRSSLYRGLQPRRIGIPAGWKKAIDKPEPVKQRKRSQHRLTPNPFMTAECSNRLFGKAAGRLTTRGHPKARIIQHPRTSTGDSKRCPARPQPTNAPEAYPRGTLRMRSRRERRRTAFSVAVKRGSSAAPSAAPQPARTSTRCRPHAPHRFPNPPRSAAAHCSV